METVKLSVDPRGVADLCLARPEKHNALSALMIAELTEAARQVAADPAVRVVVMRGEGRSFCAGGDLGWMQDQMRADPQTRAREARALAQMLAVLNDLPKPLIGRIEGNAFGGGVGLACVCDVAIGTQAARFGLTETRLGLIPATIGPYVLARLGEAMARRVFMSARLFDAAEAERLGLLARVVAPDEIDAAIEAEVSPYLSCAPGAVAAAKALALSLGARPTEQQIDMTIAALVARWETQEAQDGIAAFFDRRPAPWVSE